LRVRAKRSGWNEKTNVTEDDILDPYDYAEDEVEGELVVQKVAGPYVKAYTRYTVDGQCVDPETIRKLGN
jgi:hypothetical protein